MDFMGDGYMGRNSRRWVATALGVALLSGCGTGGPANADGPTGTSTTPVNGRWSGIGKTCAPLTAPAFAGVKDGVFDTRLETDAKMLYAASCVYGGTGPTARIMVNYMIDKEDGDETPAEVAGKDLADARKDERPGTELSGVGEGAVVVVENGTMQATTWDRNATVMAMFPMDRVKTDADLAKHTDDVTAVLKDLLTVLRG
ncbi:hypothetical protein L3i22_076990 [Actinoplanes sp. L3-i22]|nr:hypothetical protein L3i22_076990 [Actinoplanes sp. L3-i22]